MIKHTYMFILVARLHAYGLCMLRCVYCCEPMCKSQKQCSQQTYVSYIPCRLLACKLSHYFNNLNIARKDKRQILTESILVFFPYWSSFLYSGFNKAVGERMRYIALYDKDYWSTVPPCLDCHPELLWCLPLSLTQVSPLERFVICKVSSIRSCLSSSW